MCRGWLEHGADQLDDSAVVQRDRLMVRLLLVCVDDD